jgi:uncharacterized protein (TIGR02466 family)
MDCNIIGMFPTAFGEFRLKLTDAELYNLINNVEWYNHYQGYTELPMYEITKQNLQEDKNFNNLSNIILECAKEFCKNVGYKPHDLYITSMWMNKFDQGQTIGPHTHTNSLLSGVYYLNSVPEQGGTDFFNPVSKMRNTISVSRDESVFLTDKVTSKAEPNKLIIWPSYVEHRSEKNSTNKSRYTLSFNILPSKLGNQEHFNWAELR